MARLADGDRSAFSPVYEALWPVLRKFVARQLPAVDSEDAAQEALLKVFCRASDFDPERDALTWALGIAAFEVRTVRKRVLRRKEALGEPPRPSGAGESMEDDVISRDLQSVALEVLGTMEPSDIETLLNAASGRRSSVRAATFRKRLQRALSRMRIAWRTRHGAD
jgi:RNA polymerase sigma-70 factor (ECF subfamily)